MTCYFVFVENVVVTRPEFDLHGEILVGFLAHQIAGDVLVGHLIGNHNSFGDVPV